MLFRSLLFELDAGLNLGKCIGWPWGVSSTYFQISRSVADDFSLELWFRTTAYVSASDVYYNGPALFGGEVSGYVNDFAVTFPNGHIVAGTGNTDVHISSGGRLDTGDWKHVVFTRLKSGGVLRLYVNGLLVNGYSGANASSLTSSTYLGIGGFNVGTSPQFYAGAICHAAIYNAVLTQNSVYAHYLAGMGW